MGKACVRCAHNCSAEPGTLASPGLLRVSAPSPVPVLGLWAQGRCLHPREHVSVAPLFPPVESVLGTSFWSLEDSVDFPFSVGAPSWVEQEAARGHSSVAHTLHQPLLS